MDPMWSALAPMSYRLMDPLAMSRVSDRMTSELLTGITVMTDRARYYSFYVWAIYDINKKMNINNFQQFRRAFYDRERAHMMACVVHENTEGDRDHSSILGSQKGRGYYDDKMIRLDFKHLNNPLGGYGYYYQASLLKLGLTERHPMKDTVTPLGQKVAKAFEENIKDTKFFLEYADKKEVPTTILQEYGDKACLCMLPEEQSSDRKILRTILLGLDPQNELDMKRRETLLLILYDIYICSKHGIDLDDSIFLDASYFRQISTSNGPVDIEFHQMFDDVVQKWRMFRAHDYFAYACECFLSSFLRTLNARPEKGVTMESFLHMIDCPETISIISNTFGISLSVSSLKQIKLKELALMLIKTITNKETELVDKQTSANFDLACTLNSEVNERKIFDSLSECFASSVFDLSAATALALTLLLTLYVRFLHSLKKPDKYWRWLGGHTIGPPTDLSPFKFVGQMNEEMRNADPSVFDFLKWFIENYILRQHQEVRNEKMYGMTRARPVSWFHSDGSVFRLDRLYDPKNRSSRFGSCLQILKDLGYCKTSKGITRLTSDGIDLLRKFTSG